MKAIYWVPVTLLSIFLPSYVLSQAAGTSKVVCFYDSRSYNRPDSGKFRSSDFDSAISKCSHLVYGYAKIDPDTFKLKARDDVLDTENGKRNYMAFTLLKRRFAGLKVLLSVGGWADIDESDKYMTLLREADKRATFIASVNNFLQKYEFDGLDLAWQFPWQRAKHTSTAGSVFHKFKKTFGLTKGNKDEQGAEHRQGFTALIKDLKTALKTGGKQLTVSVIPHTNYTVYFDSRLIHPHLDAVHLMAFDYVTAEDKISPDTADYPAPLYSTFEYERKQDFNMDYTVTWFLSSMMPANKLVLGIPAHARTWKLTKDSSETGHPPITAEGPGAEGYLSDQRGILSYPEVCTMLKGANNNDTKGLLRKVEDSTKRLGNYAYRLVDGDREGLWVGYENPEIAETKALYAKKKGMAGVALIHINDDDFKGACTGEKYPLLKSITL